MSARRVGVLVAATALLHGCGAQHAPSATLAGSVDGEWCLMLDADIVGGRCATVALAAVDTTARGTSRLDELAVGVVTAVGGTFEGRIPEGARVGVRRVAGDSLELDASSTRGDYRVVLRGELRGDTLRGLWRGVLARSGGGAGNFRMLRRH
jgi:hypothetical protein